jgi:hypothetical protein
VKYVRFPGVVRETGESNHGSYVYSMLFGKDVEAKRELIEKT